MRLLIASRAWDAGTHMTRQEWATTCRRVQGRIDIMPDLTSVENVSQGTVKPTSPKLSGSTPAATHKLAIQVNQNDKAVMDLALNNAKNVIDYYKAKGETVAVEIVTYGPGLHMLRSDTSPVKERIAPMALENRQPGVHRLRQHPGQPGQGRGQARHADQRG